MRPRPAVLHYLCQLCSSQVTFCFGEYLHKGVEIERPYAHIWSWKYFDLNYLAIFARHFCDLTIFKPYFGNHIFLIRKAGNLQC